MGLRVDRVPLEPAPIRRAPVLGVIRRHSRYPRPERSPLYEESALVAEVLSCVQLDVPTLDAEEVVLFGRRRFGAHEIPHLNHDESRLDPERPPDHVERLVIRSAPRLRRSP